MPRARAVSRPHWRRRLSATRLAALAIAAVVALPLLSVAWLALARAGDQALPWGTVIAGHALNTALLMALVGIGVALLGTGAAWLASRHDFPGRRLLDWALALPLAIPAYLLAFIYADLLEYAGPVQKALRQLFGWQGPGDYHFPEIRSLPGAALVLTLALYPYVYLLARATFLSQTGHLMEAARMLGKGPWRAFFRVALPTAWPAIAAGSALALMETLNDYGVVDFLAVPTLTVGIFDTWLNMNDMAGAARLGLLMLGMVLVLLIVERRARGERRFHDSPAARRMRRLALRGWRGWLATGACLLPVALGFALPVAVLAAQAMRFWPEALENGLLQQALNSLLLAMLAAITATTLGLTLAAAARLDSHPATRAAARLGSIGYAMPGAMLAVGLLHPLATLDNGLNILATLLGLAAPGLVFTGSILALVIGYNARFMALALGAAESGLARVSPSMEAAARTLGATPGAVLRRVYLPLLRPALLSGALIVFVDTLKELPLTLLLRPFDYPTLATTAYEFASDEMFEEAALHALVIIAFGMLPLALLARALREKEDTRP